MSDNKVVGEVYVHIGNGGLNFAVKDDEGPTIEIKAYHFGHTTNTTCIFTDKKTLKEIGEMFIKASEYDNYSEEYCHVATIQDKTSSSVDRTN